MNEEHPPDPSQTPPCPEAIDADAELERQVAEAMDGQDMEQLLAAADAPQTPAEAQPPEGPDPPGGLAGPRLVRGRIAAIHDEDVFVNVQGADGKNQGVVPLSQFERPPRTGSVMDFVVQRLDPSQGLMILSREGAVGRATWDQLARGSVVEARVTAVNKGGLELEIVGGIDAFMPASSVDRHYVDNLEQFVGQKLKAQVQEINRRSKKIVLNRRNLLEAQRKAKEAQLWKELQVGQTREGVIASVADYGVFVDLGGVDGLVHVSDMSYSRVAKPSDIASVGQSVTVQILKIDPEKKRISLGIKQVQPDPWTEVQRKYETGSLVEGTVSSIAPFGAFVQIEDAVEGLVHISELSHSRVHHVQDVLQTGEKKQFRILGIDPDNHRIRLSLKAVDLPPSTTTTPSAQASRRRATKKPSGPLKGGLE